MLCSALRLEHQQRRILIGVAAAQAQLFYCCASAARPPVGKRSAASLRRALASCCSLGRRYVSATPAAPSMRVEAQAASIGVVAARRASWPSRRLEQPLAVAIIASDATARATSASFTQTYRQAAASASSAVQRAVELALAGAVPKSLKLGGHQTSSGRAAASASAAIGASRCGGGCRNFINAVNSRLRAFSVQCREATPLRACVDAREH